MTIVSPLTARKRPHLDEMDFTDPLDNKLGDPVPPSDGQGLIGVCVEQVHQDLAAVARVHCAGCVQHGDAMLGSQP